MLDTPNLLREAESLGEYWSPRILGEFNGQYVKVAKLLGEFVWHDHREQDELFLVLKGQLEIRYRDASVTLNAGDMHVVPRGIEHFPVATEECCLALFEPKETAHTGEVVADKTRSIEEQLGK